MAREAFPRIYDYQDHRRYLRDWYAARKAIEPGYSHTVFARKAGFASRAQFPNVASGAINITGPSVERFADSLDLDAQEREYFRLLVAAGQASDATVREARRDELRRWLIQHRSRDFTAEEIAGLIRKWPRFVVLHLTRLRGFRPEAGWISRELAPWMTRRQAEDALRFLESSGFISVRGNRLTWSMAGPSFQYVGGEFRPASLLRWIGRLYQAAGGEGRQGSRQGFWMQSILSEREADRILSRLAERSVQAIPARKGTRVKGRLYTICVELFPVSRRRR